jgi:hypothetical protein
MAHNRGDPESAEALATLNTGRCRASRAHNPARPPRDARQGRFKSRVTSEPSSGRPERAVNTKSDRCHEAPAASRRAAWAADYCGPMCAPVKGVSLSANTPSRRDESTVVGRGRHALTRPLRAAEMRASNTRARRLVRRPAEGSARVQVQHAEDVREIIRPQRRLRRNRRRDPASVGRQRSEVGGVSGDDHPLG